MKIDETRISIKEVSDMLYEISQTIDADACEEDGLLEVRLQVVDGSYDIHTGDPSYDQDQRGYWGAGSLEPEMSHKACRETARELLDQAADHCASVKSD